jgi:hypothetical protein
MSRKNIRPDGVRMLCSTVHEYLKAKEMTLRKARESVFSEGGKRRKQACLLMCAPGIRIPEPRGAFSSSAPLI